MILYNWKKKEKERKENVIHFKPVLSLLCLDAFLVEKLKREFLYLAESGNR